MKGARLNEALIEKNIAQIEFYGNEEFSTLSKYCSKFETASNYYQSRNTSLLLSHINRFRNDTNLVLSKRMQYVKVLIDVLAQYRELTVTTTESFGELKDV